MELLFGEKRYQKFEDREQTENRGKQYYSVFIALTISVISFVVAALCFFSPLDKGIYKYIFIVPFFYACLNLLFFNIYDRKSFPKLAILSLMFIRYCLSPFFVYLDDFPINLYYQVFSEDTILRAIYLMITEMTLIIFSIWVFERRRKRRITAYATKKIVFLGDYNFGKLNFLLILMILFTFGIYLRYPALLNYYYFIFDSTIQETNNLNLQQLQTYVPNGLRWIGYTLGELTRYILLAKLISYFYKRYMKNASSFYIVMSIIVIGLNAMITTNRQMAGLIVSAAFYTQLLHMYSRKKKLLINLSILLGGAILITLVLFYFKESASYHTLSSLMQLYTNGFYGIYQSIESITIYDPGFFEKFQLLLFGDTLGFINGLSSLLNGYDQINESTTVIYNQYLYGNGPLGGQIIPMLTQGYAYFGLLGSTIFSLLSIALLYKFEDRIEGGKGTYLSNMILAIIFAVSPIMYNYSIVILLLSTIVLPLYIASKINKIKLKKGASNV